MPFRPIDEPEWQGCFHLYDQVDSIRRQADYAIELLRRDFVQQDGTNVGLEIGQADLNGTVTVRCPAVSGRLRLEFALVGETLVGRYVVERRDPRQATEVWEAVWAFGVGGKRGDYQGFWLGDDPQAQNAKLSLGNVPGSVAGLALFRLGMSIVAALIGGPKVA